MTAPSPGQPVGVEPVAVVRHLERIALGLIHDLAIAHARIDDLESQAEQARINRVQEVLSADKE